MTDNEKLLKFLMKYREKQKESPSALGLLGTPEYFEEKKKRRRKLAKEVKFEQTVDNVVEIAEEKEQKINELLELMIEKSKIDIDLKKEIKAYVERIKKSLGEFYKEEAKKINVLKKLYQKKLKELDKHISDYDISMKKLERAIFEALSSQTRLEQSITLHNNAIDQLNQKIHEFNDKILKLNER